MYELSEPKRTAKRAPPQDCTGDVHHGFRGGGARIVGFDSFAKSERGLTNGGLSPKFSDKIGGNSALENPA